MATKTNYLEMISPDATDKYNIAEHAGNLNILDSKIEDMDKEIEAIENASDVVDIVAVYDYNNYTDPKPTTDIVHYDTTDLGPNDMIKCLKDESQTGTPIVLDDAPMSYYRTTVDSSGTKTLTLVNTVGPYLTKTQILDLLPTVEEVTS